MSRITEYLGIDSVPLREGFVKNERAGAMAVCQTCGALVAYEAQDLHLTWHAEGANTPAH